MHEAVVELSYGGRHRSRRHAQQTERSRIEDVDTEQHQHRNEQGCTADPGHRASEGGDRGQGQEREGRRHQLAGTAAMLPPKALSPAAASAGTTILASSGPRVPCEEAGATVGCGQRSPADHNPGADGRIDRRVREVDGHLDGLRSRVGAQERAPETQHTLRCVQDLDVTPTQDGQASASAAADDGSARASRPGSACWVSTLFVATSGGAGNQAADPQPPVSSDCQGIGARHPSRPPGSTTRSGGTSASSRPNSSPW